MKVTTTLSWSIPILTVLTVILLVHIARPQPSNTPLMFDCFNQLINCMFTVIKVIKVIKLYAIM